MLWYTEQNTIWENSMYLETPRLTLREFTPADVNGASYLQDKAVMEFIEPPFSPLQISDFITRCGMCHPPLVYALAETQTQVLIGHVIFHAFHHSNTFELGWVLAKNHWGNGYAKEIGQALLHHAFSTLAAQEVVAHTVPQNLACIALLNSLGMTDQGIHDGLLQFSIKQPQ